MVSENKEQANMDTQLSTFVERMRKAAGENLVSVVLYGSAASGHFVENRSDVNLLCVFDSLGEREIEAVSTVVQWWSRELKHRPPMVLTLLELTSSADVFAIETLDIKAQHKMLFGRDVMGSVHVPMNLHRVQVEHELRILILRLRQHYLLANASKEELEAALARSASSAATLLRHALIAVDGDVPPGSRAALPRVAEVFAIDLAPVQSVLALHDGTRNERDIKSVYRSFVDCLQTVVNRIDEVVPKKQLKRVTTS